MDFLKAFQEIDTDYSGEITREELQAYMLKNHYKPNLVDKWLEIFDIDDSGTITLEEYCDILGVDVPDNYKLAIVKDQNSIPPPQDNNNSHLQPTTGDLQGQSLPSTNDHPEDIIKHQDPKETASNSDADNTFIVPTKLEDSSLLNNGKREEEENGSTPSKNNEDSITPTFVPHAASERIQKEEAEMAGKQAEADAVPLTSLVTAESPEQTPVVEQAKEEEDESPPSALHPHTELVAQKEKERETKGSQNGALNEEEDLVTMVTQNAAANAPYRERNDRPEEIQEKSVQLKHPVAKELVPLMRIEDLSPPSAARGEPIAVSALPDDDILRHFLVARASQIHPDALLTCLRVARQALQSVIAATPPPAPQAHDASPPPLPSSVPALTAAARCIKLKLDQRHGPPHWQVIAGRRVGKFHAAVEHAANCFLVFCDRERQFGFLVWRSDPAAPVAAPAPSLEPVAVDMAAVKSPWMQRGGDKVTSGTVDVNLGQVQRDLELLVAL